MSGKDDAVTVVGQVAEDYQFTLLQDSWHFNDANFDFAWSKEVVQELASKGVKHYITEYPSYFQPIIESYTKGEYTREQAIELFSGMWKQQSQGDQKRTAENFADLIDACKENNIKVHAIDKQGEFASLLSVISVKHPSVKNVDQLKNAIEYEIANRGEDFCGGMLVKASKALNKMGLSDETPLDDSKFKDTLQKGVDGERKNHDKILVKAAKEALGGEKGAGTLGFIHGKQQQDFDELFGNGKVGKVLLTPSKATLHDIMRPSAVDAQEMPATIVYTDASRWQPGHQVEVWQHDARKIGSEMKISEYKESDYSQLKLPNAAEIARAPKAIPVDETPVKGR